MVDQEEARGDLERQQLSNREKRRRLKSLEVSRRVILVRGVREGCLRRLERQLVVAMPTPPSDFVVDPTIHSTRSSPICTFPPYPLEHSLSGRRVPLERDPFEFQLQLRCKRQFDKLRPNDSVSKLERRGCTPSRDRLEDRENRFRGSWRGRIEHRRKQVYRVLLLE